MKSPALLIAMLVVGLVLADSTTNNTSAPIRKLDRRKMAQRWYQRTGGHLEVPNSRQGRIVFVDAQSGICRAWLNEFVRKHQSLHHFDFSVEDGSFALPRPVLHGNATLYVVNDAMLPSLLHAPEDRWTMVNVSRLREGNGQKPQFFEARVKKELTRGFCLLAGTQTSNYPGSLLTTVTAPEDLDKFMDAELPIDIPERFKPYLAGFGIRPAVFTTYKKACYEGWAPAPTNDVQRAIWEQVHQIPDKPLTIEYDPKRDK